MPRVAPLRAITYALDRYARTSIPERVGLRDDPDSGSGRRVADLTDVVCPPYDVISPALQAELLARDPHNAVRLELSAEPEPHAAAAATLHAWLADGTLQRAAEPSVYAYAHATSRAPDEPLVQGLLARLELEPFGRDVRAHEHTLTGPKADRLAHLQATRTQVSPVLAVYFDGSERLAARMALAGEEWRARDPDGLLHRLARVEPDPGLLDDLSGQRLYLADGHHRYETALTYQARVRSDPRWTDAPAGSLAADWIMVVLMNAELEELEILATHRLILDADPEVLRSLVRDATPLWQAQPIPPDELHARLEDLRDAEEPVFGLVLPEGEGWLLVGDVDAVADRMRREPISTAARRLDLAVLHATILADRLGIEPGVIAAGGRLAYTRSEADARAAVARGDAQAAILVRPTRLGQLAEVAGAGDVMPQKSTYFYPKLLTGMALNPLED